MDNAFSKAVIDQIWSARQASTVRKYCFSLRKFFAFLCIFNESIQLPASAMDAAKYIAFMRTNSASHSAFKMILVAIKWVNNFFPGINKFNCPLEDNFLLRLRDSALRESAGGKNRKETISGDIIGEMINSQSEPLSLISLRNILMPALGYSLLLRHDELSHLNCLYISERSEGFVFLISSSKTDVYRNGKSVFLAKDEKKNSVFDLFRRYLNITGLRLGQNHFLFTPIIKDKIVNSKLSYSVFYNNIKTQMARLGFDPKFFGTHSVRSGAATDLASKVTEYELLITGRWRDPRSLNSYVKLSDERRFHISQELSLNVS